MMNVEIRGSGASWACFVGGRQVDTATNTYEKACIKAMKLERNLQKVAQPCLCCAATFEAAHRHNRLCTDCTAFASGAMV